MGLSTVRARLFANENLLFYQPQVGDHFGWALATGDFNGDGADDLATGIPRDDGIVRGSAAGLDPSHSLTLDQDVAGMNGESAFCDRFGAALAVGDFGRVNVIYGEDSGLDSGHAQTWTQGIVLSPGTDERGDHFGFALAAGDFNRDGADDLAIGQPGEEVLGPNDGASPWSWATSPAG